MRLRPLGPVLLAAFLLAGCSGGGGNAGRDADGTVTSTASDGPGGNDTPPPAPVEVPVDWSGHLINGAWYCEGVVFGDCGAAPADAAFGVNQAVEGLEGNVTGTLELSWTPESAVTDQLVIDVTVYTPGCDDCPFLLVGHTAGLSPLTVDLDTEVPAGAVLGLSVYVDKYATHPLASFGVSGDQDFTVTGILAVLP